MSNCVMIEPEDGGMGGGEGLTEGVSLGEMFDIPAEYNAPVPDSDPVDDWGLGKPGGAVKMTAEQKKKAAVESELAYLNEILRLLTADEKAALIGNKELNRIYEKIECLKLKNASVKGCNMAIKSYNQLRQMAIKAQQDKTGPGSSAENPICPTGTKKCPDGSFATRGAAIQKPNGKWHCGQWVCATSAGEPETPSGDGDTPPTTTPPKVSPKVKAAALAEVKKLQNILNVLTAKQEALLPEELKAINDRIECLKTKLDRSQCNQVTMSLVQLRRIANERSKTATEAEKKARKELIDLADILSRLSDEEKVLLPEELKAVDARIACLSAKLNPAECLEAAKTLEQLKRIAYDRKTNVPPPPPPPPPEEKDPPPPENNGGEFNREEFQEWFEDTYPQGQGNGAESGPGGGGGGFVSDDSGGMLVPEGGSESEYFGHPSGPSFQAESTDSPGFIDPEFASEEVLVQSTEEGSKGLLDSLFDWLFGKPNEGETVAVEESTQMPRPESNVQSEYFGIVDQESEVA